MSFTIFLNSNNGTKTGLSITSGNANNCSVSYNFDFSTVPPHPQGSQGKYKLFMTLLTSALSSAATAQDIGIVTANFNCMKYVYTCGTANGAYPSDYIGYVTPLAYSSSNLISQYVDNPLYLTKPTNNTFTIEIKKFDGTYLTNISSTVNYILSITFTAIIEDNGIAVQRSTLLDYNSNF